MQTTAHFDSMDGVVVRCEQSLQLLDGCVIRSTRPADEHLLADDKHIAAVHCPRRFYRLHLRYPPERVRDRRRFHSTRRGAWTCHDCELVDHDRRVLDEDRIRHVQSRSEAHNGTSSVRETPLVGIVL
jgi:hypothetical protein